MINYKLLTPGPLTTSKTVKEEMMVDHCTWDNDYKQITQWIRGELLELAHVSPEEYTAVLMQGSGTFGVESAITSSVGRDGKVLILSNGAYGERQEDICKHAGLKYRIKAIPLQSRSRMPRTLRRSWRRIRRSPMSPWSIPRPPPAYLNDIESVGEGRQGRRARCSSWTPCPASAA